MWLSLMINFIEKNSVKAHIRICMIWHKSKFDSLVKDTHDFYENK